MIFQIAFLLVVGIALPWLGWASLKSMRSMPDSYIGLADVRAMALQTGILQGVIATLAWLAGHEAGVALSWWSRADLSTVLAALAIVCGFLTLAWLEATRARGSEHGLQAALRRVPPGDPLLVAMVLIAGVVEEFAYRGVLTFLLAAHFGLLPAAAVSAVLFGLAHLSSGWRAASISVLFAAAMQWLVVWSGGLLAAILVHAVYDLIAAWLGHRLADRSPVNSSCTEEGPKNHG